MKKLEPDTPEIRSMFDRHQMIAKGEHRVQHLFTEQEILRSQLIASAGYTAYREMLAEAKG